MKTINEADLLYKLIISHKKKRADELELVKGQLHEVCESLRPNNLIKNVFHEVTHSSEINDSLTNTTIGLGTGFLFKKIFLGNSHSLGKKIVGTFIQFGVTNLVAKHFDEIKLISKYLFKQISESDIVKNDTRKNELPI